MPFSLKRSSALSFSSACWVGSFTGQGKHLVHLSPSSLEPLSCRCLWCSVAGAAVGAATEAGLSHPPSLTLVLVGDKHLDLRMGVCCQVKFT